MVDRAGDIDKGNVEMDMGVMMMVVELATLVVDLMMLVL